MTIIGILARRSTFTRQLHTIVSREIIKPSSSTPSHLKTYNLSLLDQISMNTFMQMVAFYPSNPSIHPTFHEKTLHMKNSLSQTLTRYYPFAGRHANIAPAQVDCNDDGAEFVVASIDITLSDFLQNYQHEDLDQFFPYSRAWYNSKHDGQNHSNQLVIPLAVQVNYFECGGVAVAVSLSHKIADGSSLACFLYDWGKLTQVCLTGLEHADLNINPKFMSFPNISINFNGFTPKESDNCVTKSFMFSNLKLNNLKLKVKSMTSDSKQPVANPTRVEVLNWLLYKCAVAAMTKNNSRFVTPSGIRQAINIRDKMIEPLQRNSIGNHYMLMKIFTRDESDLNPEAFINEVKKQKMHFRSLQNIESAIDLVLNMSTSETDFQEAQRFIDGGYFCSSLCGYSLYEIDFGWGKPVKVTVAGNLRKDSFVFMDAPNKDGIEALVCLGKEEMAIIQTDPELLAFC